MHSRLAIASKVVRLRGNGSSKLTYCCIPELDGIIEEQDHSSVYIDVVEFFVLLGSFATPLLSAQAVWWCSTHNTTKSGKYLNMEAKC